MNQLQKVTIGNVKVEYNPESKQIMKMDDPTGTLDFTVPDTCHPVNLFITDQFLVLECMYALDQRVRISWQDNLCDMVIEFLKAPAVAYRHVHNMVCRESQKRLRLVLATYVSHLSRTDTEAASNWVTRYLRALAVVANKEHADKLEAALQSDDQHRTFVETLTAMMTNDELIKNYIKMLELYFGMIRRDKVTIEALKEIPLERVDSYSVPSEIQEWAYKHDIIIKEQADVVEGTKTAMEQ